MKCTKHVKVDRLPVLLAVMLLGICMSGCGTSATRVVSTAHPHSVEDRILDFGHPASEEDARSIAELVRHYYAAAAAENGAEACAQIYVILREAIPEEYGKPPGPRFMRGRTCRPVMSKLFKHEHRQLLAESAKLRIVSVRVEGKHAYAILRFGSVGGLRDVMLHTEVGPWRMDSLLAGPLS